MTTVETLKNDIGQIKFVSNDFYGYNRNDLEQLLLFLSNYKIITAFDQSEEQIVKSILNELIIENDGFSIDKIITFLKRIGIINENDNKDSLGLSFDKFYENYLENRVHENYLENTNRIVKIINEHLEKKSNFLKDIVITNEQKINYYISSLINQQIFKPNELKNTISLYQNNLWNFQNKASQDLFELESKIYIKLNEAVKLADDINDLNRSIFGRFGKKKKIESNLISLKDALNDYWNMRFNLVFKELQNRYLIRTIDDNLRSIGSEIDEIRFLIKERIYSLKRKIDSENQSFDIKENYSDQNHSYEQIIERICEQNPSYVQIRGYITCHDGSIVPLIIKKNNIHNYEIFSLSDVQGMGMGEYQKKIFENDFSDYYILNSFQGISYVCLRKQFWGLLKLYQNPKSNNYFGVEWEVISEFKYSTIEEMLSDYGIVKDNFII